jgi:hypothetical protein
VENSRHWQTTSDGPVHAPVLDGFRDLWRVDIFLPGQINDSARHLQDAMVGARRQAKTLNRIFQQDFATSAGRAQLIDFF